MSNARENVNFLTSADWDIATLRLANWGSGAVPPQVMLKQNYVASDGGGLFRYDASDTTTADDGVDVVVDAAGNRWKRQRPEQQLRDTAIALTQGGLLRLRHISGLSAFQGFAARGLAVEENTAANGQFGTTRRHFYQLQNYDYTATQGVFVNPTGVPIKNDGFAVFETNRFVVQSDNDLRTSSVTSSVTLSGGAITSVTISATTAAGLYVNGQTYQVRANTPSNPYNQSFVGTVVAAGGTIAGQPVTIVSGGSGYGATPANVIVVVESPAALGRRDVGPQLDLCRDVNLGGGSIGPAINLCYRSSTATNVDTVGCGIVAYIINPTTGSQETEMWLNTSGPYAVNAGNNPRLTLRQGLRAIRADQADWLAGGDPGNGNARFSAMYLDRVVAGESYGGGYPGGSHHLLNATFATVENQLVLNIGTDNVTYQPISVYSVTGSGWNSAAAQMHIGKNSTTSRSINAAGTVNASGTDYAEFERLANFDERIPKGAVIGRDASGRITTRFDDAVTFGVKSTDPSFVGGDKYFAQAPPVPTLREPPPPVLYCAPRPPEPTREFVDGKEVVTLPTEEAVSAWRRLYDFELAHNEAARIAHAQEVGKARDKYAAEMAAYNAAHDALRQPYDRIAYSGRAPVNAAGAVPGDWIWAERAADGSVTAGWGRRPTADQVDRIVGRCSALLEDGRPEALIIVGGVCVPSEALRGNATEIPPEPERYNAP